MVSLTGLRGSLPETGPAPGAELGHGQRKGMILFMAQGKFEMRCMMRN